MTIGLGRVGVWEQWSEVAGLGRAQLGELAAELESLGYGAIWLGGARADLAPAQTMLG